MIFCCFDIKGLKDFFQGTISLFFCSELKHPAVQHCGFVISLFCRCAEWLKSICSNPPLKPFLVCRFSKKKKKSNGFLFHASSRLFIGGVKGAHEDSMSIFRSIVNTYPPVLALHLHSNGIWTFIWKPQVFSLN